MPEGHTVHRLAATFGELFDGSRVSLSSPQGRFAGGAALLDGRVLVASEAYGKQMFLGDNCGLCDPSKYGSKWITNAQPPAFEYGHNDMLQ